MAAENMLSDAYEWHARDVGRERCCVITGGTRGIGRAVAEYLYANGWDVFVIARSQPSDFPKSITVVVGDVRDESTYFKLDRALGARTCVAFFANAGIFKPVGRLDAAEFSMDSFDEILGVNVYGVLHSAKWFVRHVAKHQVRDASLVITTSVLAERMCPVADTGYVTSKGAALQMARALSFEYARAAHPVKVNTLSPGWTETDMTKAFWQTMKEEISETIPNRTWTSLAALAAQVEMLFNPSKSAGVTGQNFVIEGGAYIAYPPGMGAIAPVGDKMYGFVLQSHTMPFRLPHVRKRRADILIVCGSPRESHHSRFARALMSRIHAQTGGLRAVMLPKECIFELPLFVHGESKPNEHVHKMLGMFSSASVVVLVTPVYNNGIPGTLKNMIDWASRVMEHGYNVLDAIHVATASVGSTDRKSSAMMQHHLRSVMEAAAYPGRSYFLRDYFAKRADVFDDSNAYFKTFVRDVLSMPSPHQAYHAVFNQGVVSGNAVVRKEGCDMRLYVTLKETPGQDPLANHAIHIHDNDDGKPGPHFQVFAEEEHPNHAGDLAHMIQVDGKTHAFTLARSLHRYLRCGLFIVVHAKEDPFKPTSDFGPQLAVARLVPSWDDYAHGGLALHTPPRPM